MTNKLTATKNLFLKITEQGVWSRAQGVFILVICSLLCALCFLATPSFAEERTTIDSESLEYDGETFTYTAKGHVKIRKGLATVQADEMRYNDKTSGLTAEGNVVYADPDVRIKAKKADLNLENKTGTLYEAEVFSKKDNFHINGVEIEKTGEKEYTLKKASFTTCDAPLPAWCFKGSNVDLIVGDSLKAKNVTFDIKGQPVFFSPYISAGLSNERKTGFLIPTMGYVKGKGVHYEQPFFWAISDNRDATLILDVFSKRGVGEGLEYRFLEPDGSKGNLWTYHLRDNELGRDFWDIRGAYDRDRDARITGYLNINYINTSEFYREYDPFLMSRGKRFMDAASYLTVSTGRFFESTGEVSLRFDNSRLFLTSRYLVDLQEGVQQSTIAQRLPEMGYFMNPRKVGPVVFSFSSTLSNFWRESGASGQRLDLSPRFSYSFGSDFIINQSLRLRETAYFLSEGGDFGTSPHRESLDYTVTAQTRLMKRYSSFIHIMEPSLGYTFIPSAESNLPLFDSTELYTKTSRIELRLLNRFLDSHGEFLTVRVTQPFDSYNGDRPFLPLRLQAAIHRPVAFRGEVSYDVNTGRVETINSNIYFTLPSKMILSLGERYNRTGDIHFYSVGMNYAFSKAISAETNFWYDAKSGGLKDVIAKVKYQKQCWGVNMIYTKREQGYSISVLFDLLGLGTIKL
ncbi:MAG: LPS assembly protein LptD [Nitrospirae bacterium]|nr:LPS assembly protein LptD [Nitrospirota bacterium]